MADNVTKNTFRKNWGQEQFLTAKKFIIKFKHKLYLKLIFNRKTAIY